MSSSVQTRGVVLSLTSAFWAALFLVPYKAAALEAPSDLVALAMLTSAALANTVLGLGLHLRNYLRDPRTLSGFDRTALWAGFVLGVFTVLGNIALAESLVRVQPAITSVVLQSQVVFVVLGEWLLLRQRMSLRLILGALVAVAGFVIMQVPWVAEVRGNDVTGVIWAGVAALAFGSMLIFTRHVIRRINAVLVNALRLWLAVAALSFVTFGTSDGAPLDLKVWLLAGVAGLLGPTTSRLFLMFSVRYISASQSKLANLVSPLFALGLGLVFFGRLPELNQLVGGAIMLAGVALPLLDLMQDGESRAPQAKS